MMINKIALIGVLVLSAFGANAQAQTEFQKFIETTFEDKISHIESHEDVSNLMRSFSNDLTWVDVKVGIDGKVSTPQKLNKAALSKQLHYLASRPALQLKWKIIEYHELTKREDRRIASLKVEISIFANGKLLTSGNNIVTLIAQKKDGFYLINYLDLLRISTENYLGPCYVKITEKDDAYLTEVAFPDGNTYSQIEATARIIPAEPFKAVIIEGIDQRYYWNPKTNAVSLDRDGRVIGSATNNEQIIIAVISNKSQDRCSSIVKMAK